MKKIVTLFFVILFTDIVNAQFDIYDYNQYLKSHRDMSFEQLLNEYPAGLFKLESLTNLDSIDYFDTIDSKYNLTPYEKELIQKHGFMVTERINYTTFQEAMYDIYHKDLPVYVSADAILHAIHFSFDKILEDFEKGYLSYLLKKGLFDIQNYIPQLSGECSDSSYQQALRDLDVYINIPLNYLSKDYYSDEIIPPNFPENQELIDRLIQSVENLKLEDYKLFSTTKRSIDFSQFQPRGHYARSEELKNYFKAMMWLGRIEIYVKGPKQQVSDYSQTDNDINRQTMLASLLSYTAFKSGAIEKFNAFEEIMMELIGEQDNLTIWEIDSVMKKIGIDKANQLADRQVMNEIRSELIYLKSQGQLINSQILYSNVGLSEQVEPAYSVCLLGQRGTIDAFILGKVVYDNILYNGQKVPRFFPKTLDLLFSLGNDAAIQLLEPELKYYPYSMNLAATRYLVDNYDTTFWNKSYYTNWLHSLKALNPPKNRDSLQSFMQTAAWWQKTMNTQLAGWAELRHDFILYSKQSNSTEMVCSFPYSFIEPVPEFYNSLSNSIGKMYNITEKLYDDYSNPDVDNNLMWHLYDYFSKLQPTLNILKDIAIKELNNESFDSTEISFLKSMVNVRDDCVDYLEGWYIKMFYNCVISMDYTNKEEIDRYDLIQDYIVADIHTIPDTSGNVPPSDGFVMHSGVGPINMAVITAKGQDGTDCAYIGPVMSYYEHITKDFKRLTDEEWETLYNVYPSYKPAFTNLYLADSLGQERQGVKEILYTIPTTRKKDQPIVMNDLMLNSYPNPFSISTLISFSVPSSMTGTNAELNIYDSFGRFVRNLHSGVLSGGNYLIKWDGTDELHKQINPGIYIYNLQVGSIQQSGKLSYVK